MSRDLRKASGVVVPLEKLLKSPEGAAYVGTSSGVDLQTQINSLAEAVAQTGTVGQGSTLGGINVNVWNAYAEGEAGVLDHGIQIKIDKDSDDLYVRVKAFNTDGSHYRPTFFLETVNVRINDVFPGPYADSIPYKEDFSFVESDVNKWGDKGIYLEPLAEPGDSKEWRLALSRLDDLSVFRLRVLDNGSSNIVKFISMGDTVVSVNPTLPTELIFTPTDSSNIDVLWSDLKGEGKPEDYATNGATWGVNIGGSGLPASGATVNHTFVQGTTPVNDVTDGDIWINTSEGNKLYVYEYAVGWVARQDADLATALVLANESRAAVDGKINTFYSDEPPIDDVGEGDLWFDTNDGNHLYIYTSGVWVTAQDQSLATAIDSAATAQATADGKITTYFTEYDPYLAFTMNEGDLWYDEINKYLKRWNDETTSWTIVSNLSTLTSDLEDDARLGETADWQQVDGIGKPDDFATSSLVFTQPEPPSGNVHPLSDGDIWIDTDDSNALYVWSTSVWVLRRDSRNDEALDQVAQNELALDGKVSSFYQDEPPTGQGEQDGDIWFDTNDGNKIYLLESDVWVNRQDSAIADAINDAATAQATADGKIVTYFNVGAPTPPAGGFVVGDLWYDSNTKLLSRWDGVSAWVTVSNSFSNTSELFDDALLGETANWSSVVNDNGSRPAENATATGMDNLILNGDIELENNANFTDHTFVPAGVISWADFGHIAVTETSGLPDNFIRVYSSDLYEINYSIGSDQGGSTAYLGLACYDKTQTRISIARSYVISGTFTTIFEAASSGATEIKIVPPATTWLAGAAQFAQLDAESDNSHLPSNNYLAIADSGVDISTAGSGYHTITLDTPLTADVTVGQGVAQSTDGATYAYAAGANVPVSGTAFSRHTGTISGLNDPNSAPTANQFRIGTVYVKPILLFNRTVAGTTRIQSLSFKRLGFRLSTIEAGATVGATWGEDIIDQPADIDLINTLVGGNLVPDYNFIREYATGDGGWWSGENGVTLRYGLFGENGGAALRFDGAGAQRNAYSQLDSPFRVGSETLHCAGRVFISNDYDGETGFVAQGLNSSGAEVSNTAFYLTSATGTMLYSGGSKGSWFTFQGTFNTGALLTTVESIVPRIVSQASATTGHVIYDWVYFSKIEFGATNGAPVGSFVGDTEVTALLADVSNALANAATAQATADGKIETYWQTTAPVSADVGDLWYDTDDGNNTYRYDGASWVNVQDDDIANAVATAQTAQTTADGKADVYYQDAQPAISPIGDMWVDTNDNNKLYVSNGSSWVLAQDYIAASLTSTWDGVTGDGKPLSRVVDQVSLLSSDDGKWLRVVTITGSAGRKSFSLEVGSSGGTLVPGYLKADIEIDWGGTASIFFRKARGASWITDIRITGDSGTTLSHVDVRISTNDEAGTIYVRTEAEDSWGGTLTLPGTRDVSAESVVFVDEVIDNYGMGTLSTDGNFKVHYNGSQVTNNSESIDTSGIVSQLLDWNSALSNVPSNLSSLGGTENLLNSLISIGSNGSLTGAGGGQVTIGGLGYAGDLTATDGATWGTDITGQPNDESLLNDFVYNNGLLRNNLLSVEEWTEGKTSFVDDFGIYSNGGSNSTNEIILTDGPRGGQALVWKSTVTVDQAGTGTWCGGFDHTLTPTNGRFDHTKSYRFSCWVKLSNIAQPFYMGYGGNDVANLSNGLVNTNPYAFSNNRPPTADKWYLLVAISHGSSYTGTTVSGLSGYYDPDTGLREQASSNEYKHLTTNTSMLYRLSMYRHSLNNIGEYAYPRVDELNGNEPSIVDLLGSADVTNYNDVRIDNSGISLNSDGSLVGAGGGQVTIGGLGYTGALNANYVTNTNQLTDGAGLGDSADWNNVINQPTLGVLAALDQLNSTTYIAPGLIVSSLIAANTIVASNMVANTLTANEIAANTITANEIAANAITTSELAANAVIAENILAGVISADKLAANSVTATKIAAGSIDTSKLNIATQHDDVGNDSGLSITFDPYSATPMAMSRADGSNVFAIQVVDGQEKAIVDGIGGENFISSGDAISTAVKKSINKYYLGDGASTSASTGVNQGSGSGSAVALTVNVGESGQVSITYNYSAQDNYFNQSSNQGWTAPIWTVEIRRNTSTGTILHSQSYTGSAYNTQDFEIGVNDWFGGYNISAVGGFVDDDSAAGGGIPASGNETYYVRINRTSGTPTTLRRNSARAEAVSFLVNTLDSNSVGGYSWTDKDTGYTIKTGLVFINGNNSQTITFSDSFTTVYTALANSTLGTGDTTSGSITSLTNSAVTVTNHEVTSGNHYWIATGYTVV